MLGFTQYRSFETSKRHIEAGSVEQRARQFDSVRIAIFGAAFDCRPAGKAKAQNFGRFVEGFTDCVINRRTKAAILAEPLNSDELAVAAGDQKQQIWKFNRLAQARRERVALQMVHADKRLAGRHGERFGCHHADHHATNKAGA